MKWIPKASGKSNRFSPSLDHSYLFQDFCVVGEMWRPFDASIGVHVCVFSLNISDDTVSKLFVWLLLLCSSPPRKEVFPGYFWSVVVVVDVFFVFCLKVKDMAGSLEEGSGGDYRKEGYYGTFQPGVPQPVPPSYPVEGTPLREDYNPNRHTWDTHPLPFCGLGFGWFLFILGFFILSIPWYVGTFMFFCLRYDPREYAGLAACAIAALVVFLLGGSQMANQALF